MPNPFYEPGHARAARVNDLFTGIAHRYDLLNDVQTLGLHRLWKRRVVRLAKVGKGQLALDLCCGTGDIALRLATSGGRVVGLDFSEAMLKIASQRSCSAKTLRPNALSLLRADALRLPFPDRTFDAITVGYGLRNLASIDRGIEEIWRVAKPGARLVVLDFGKPPNALWRRLYFAHLRWSVPVLGKLLCGDWAAYAYIIESLEHYPAQGGVTARLDALGAMNLRTTSLMAGAMSIHYCEKTNEQSDG